MESLFISFVNRPYRLLISIFVSGVLCCDQEMSAEHYLLKQRHVPDEINIFICV